MDPWLQTLLTITGSVIASSGFWAYFTRRSERKGASTQLLLGLAHDRIVYLGMQYLDRGWMTKDEYDDFIKYLYNPYSKFGGNGLAEKIMQDLGRLPMYGRDRQKAVNVHTDPTDISRLRTHNEDKSSDSHR